VGLKSTQVKQKSTAGVQQIFKRRRLSKLEDMATEMTQSKEEKVDRASEASGT
jgi:hypothetical protein